MTLPTKTIGWLSAMQTWATGRPWKWLGAAMTLLAVAAPTQAWAQMLPDVNISWNEQTEPTQLAPTLKILLLLTVLSIAPAILITATSFTRIVVVLSFVKQALGTANVPPTQVILALSLLLTGVAMAPTAVRLNELAIEPYMAESITEEVAFTQGANVIRGFLLPQTREQDLTLFYELSNSPLPNAEEDVALHLLVPAFMISELRTGFEMGFLLFLPFVLIDLVVASILTSMGMVMLPPTMMSTPLKILLFVIVDGWALLTRSIVGGYV